MPFFNSIHHFIASAEQPIHSLSELDRQRFGLGNRGSTHDSAARQIFEILGINPRFQNAGNGDTNNMIKDGLLKGFFVTSGLPCLLSRSSRQPSTCVFSSFQMRSTPP
ncbi:MAG: hypothetical protein CM1200mP36_04900 [Gammaproteobacteria bacterium]|nr:MAG: hypothetical protein CM1200mP36_04900 [Gammaproteobacteria bacterium]